MKLLFLASHAWSQQTDYADLESVVSYLMARLGEDHGPVTVHVPAAARSVVEILETKGWYPVTFSSDEGPPAPHYDLGFLLVPSPLRPAQRVAMELFFNDLCTTWLAVHVPPGASKARVSVSRLREPGPDRVEPLDQADPGPDLSHLPPHLPAVIPATVGRPEGTHGTDEPDLRTLDDLDDLSTEG